MLKKIFVVFILLISFFAITLILQISENKTLKPTKEIAQNRIPKEILEIQKELAIREEGKNKLDLFSKFDGKYENEYISEHFKYKITYPNGWKLEEYEAEEIPSIRITKTSDETSFPNIEIGITSGSLCANMSCDYLGGFIHIYGFGKTEIVKGYQFIKDASGKPIDTEPLFYRFHINLYPREPTELPYIRGNFGTEEEGQEIANILGTIELLE